MKQHRPTVRLVVVTQFYFKMKGWCITELSQSELFDRIADNSYTYIPGAKTVILPVLHGVGAFKEGRKIYSSLAASKADRME